MATILMTGALLEQMPHMHRTLKRVEVMTVGSQRARTKTGQGA